MFRKTATYLIENPQVYWNFRYEIFNLKIWQPLEPADNELMTDEEN